jgi:carbamoyl-phosphate synthase small subunit
MIETHVSLFDGTNEGLRSESDSAFSVQYHPEASPGPQDSHYLFKRFTDMMSKERPRPILLEGEGEAPALG